MSVFADDLGVARPHHDRRGERYMARRDDDGDFYVPPSGRSGREQRARSAPRRGDYYDDGSDEEDGHAPRRKGRDGRATDDEYDGGRRRKAGRDDRDRKVDREARRDDRDRKADREVRRAAARRDPSEVPPPPIGSNSPIHRSPLDGDAPPASARAADDPYDEPRHRSRRERKEGGGRSRGAGYDDVDLPKSKHKDKPAYGIDDEPRSRPKRDEGYDEPRRRRRDVYDDEPPPRARRQEAPKPRRGGYYEDSDDEYAAPPRRRREARDRDAYERGYRSDGRDPRSRPRDYEERGYRTDGRDSRREREKERYDATRRRDSHREKDRRGDDYDYDRRGDSKRDRDRYADRDRHGSSKKNNKQNLNDIIAKSQKHWKSIEPVAKPLLNQVAKAYLEGNRR